MTTTITMAALAGIDVTLLARCAKGVSEMRAKGALESLLDALSTEDREGAMFRLGQLRAHNPKGCDAAKRGVRCNCGAIVEQVRGLLSRGCSDFEDSAPTRSPAPAPRTGGSFEFNPNDRSRLCCSNPDCTAVGAIMSAPGNVVGTCYTRLGGSPCKAKTFTCNACGTLHLVEFCAGSGCDDVLTWGTDGEDRVRAMYGRGGVALDTEVVAAPAPATETAPVLATIRRTLDDLSTADCIVVQGTVWEVVDLWNEQDDDGNVRYTVFVVDGAGSEQRIEGAAGETVQVLQLRAAPLTARDEYATQTITALAAGFDCECDAPVLTDAQVATERAATQAEIARTMATDSIEYALASGFARTDGERAILQAELDRRSEDRTRTITATAAGAPSVASSTSAAPVTCECGGLSFDGAGCDLCGCRPAGSSAPAILPATEHEARILDALYKAFGSCTVLYEATERSEALTMLRECGGNARAFARELLTLESVDCDRMGGNHERHLGEMRARVQRALSMLGASSNASKGTRAGARCPDCGRYLIAPQGKNWALTCCCERNAEVR